MDWDDLRFVLAAARTGSALRAARDLKVNQTTVMRRIARLESTLGVHLFESKQSGQVLTASGRDVAAAAERVEKEVVALQTALAGQERLLSGSVRVTASEVFANRIIAPCLPSFRKQHPGIMIELVTDDRRLDLARSEADIALRAGLRPEGGGIVAQRLPDAGWSVYCSRSYAEDHGIPANPRQLEQHAVIGVEGGMANTAPFRWLAAVAPKARIAARSNSLTNLLSAVKAGLGVGLLPCFVGDEEADLVRCFPPVRELDAELWLVVREELRQTPHVRTFVDYLAAHVNRAKKLLAGKS